MLDLCGVQAVLDGLEMIMTESGIKARGFQFRFSILLPPHALPPNGTLGYRELNGDTAAETFQADGTTPLLETGLEVLLGRRGHTYL